MGKKFLFYFFISFALHGLIFLALHQNAELFRPSIPISIQEKPFENIMQMVDQQTFNRQKPENSRYLSQYSHQTPQEFKGKQGQNPQPQSPPQDSSDQGILDLASSSVLYSRIDHLDKSIQEGKETLLNTQEMWFYTFHSRVKHQIYWHWIRELRAQINERAFSPSLFVTHIEAFLDDKGYLKSLIIRKKSGLEELDQASVNAIHLAHPFPNPPQELVSKDGLISLNYSFALENEPAF